MQDGLLKTSRILGEGEGAKSGETVWYAYVEPNPTSEYMDGPYTDLLNPKMTEGFIELTHEVVKTHVEDEFGKTVLSIFTDEPQYSPMSKLNSSDGEGEVFMPWTNGLVESFNREYGEDLMGIVPNIVWDTAGKGHALARTRFLSHVCDLFTDIYIGVLAMWCRANDLLCTGHMNAVGRSFFESIARQG